MAVSNTVQKLILGFLVLIVGLALIGTVASNSLVVTEKTTVYDEVIDVSSARVGADLSINETLSNFTVTNVPSGWKVDDCPIVQLAYGNDSVTLALATDYEVFLSEGILHVLNTTDTNGSLGNTTYFDYTYCADGYLNIAWGRTILNLVAGFFALALLGASVGIFYSIGKDTGIIK